MKNCIFSSPAGGFRALVKPYFLGLVLTVATAWTAAGATRAWTGNGFNSLWSNSDNWDSGAPQDGDTLTFNSNVFQKANNNDYVNLRVRSIQFTGLSGGYSLSGNPIRLETDIVASHNGSFNYVLCDIECVSGGATFYTAGSGQLEVRGTVTLANNQQLIAYTFGTNITISGAIVGNGELVKLGEAALYLTGNAANAYSGVTVVDEGDLHLAKPSAARAISPRVVIGQNPTHLSRLYDDLPGQFPPALSVLVSSNGFWYITNGATVTNLTIVNGFVAGEGLLTLQCDVTVESVADFGIHAGSGIGCRVYLGDQSRTFFVDAREFVISGQILGPGPAVNSPGIIKEGYGGMVLRNQNLYFGPTLINDGSVVVQHRQALGGTGAGAETRVRPGGFFSENYLVFSSGLPPMTNAEPLVMEGGVIDFEGTVTLNGSIVLAGSATINARTNAVPNIQSAITGTGTLTKTGGGTLTLSGNSANTFTGDTLVHGGTLLLAKSSFIPAVPGSLVIGSGSPEGSATVRFGAHDQIWNNVTINLGSLLDLAGFDEYIGDVTLNDNSDVQTGAGTLYLGNLFVNGSPALDVAVISGRIGLGPGAHRFYVGGGTFCFVLAPIIQMSTAADIVKDGTGLMRLAANNTFTGTLTVNEGNVTAAHALALGTAAGGTILNSNGSLSLDGGFWFQEEPLTLNSTNPAALASLGSGSNTWSGLITLQRTAGINVPVDAGILNLMGLFDCCAGIISGPGGITKTGPGVLLITGFGANSYAGTTMVNDGLLEAWRVQGLALPGNVIVSGSNSTLRTGRAPAANTALSPTANVAVSDGGLWGLNSMKSETIRTLTGNGTVSIRASLTVDNTAAFEFAGKLSSLGTLTKRGAGTMRLTGTSDRFFGLTVVDAGMLEVNGALDHCLVQVNAGALLQGTGRVGPVDLNGSGGVIAPGSSPAILTCGNLNADALGSGTLQLELNGATPGAGYDQLNVLGTVTLSNIALNASLNFVSVSATSSSSSKMMTPMP